MHTEKARKEQLRERVKDLDLPQTVDGLYPFLLLLCVHTCLC